MTVSKFIDSSVWIDYLINGNHKDLIDTEGILLISVLSIFEIKKKLIKSNVPGNITVKSIDFIKKRSLLIDLTAEIAEKSVEVSVKNNLPAIDSLIYISAIESNATLFTLDNDFRGLKNVVVLAVD